RGGIRRIAHYGPAAWTIRAGENVRLRRDDRDGAANHGTIVIDYDWEAALTQSDRDDELNLSRANCVQAARGAVDLNRHSIQFDRQGRCALGFRRVGVAD